MPDSYAVKSAKGYVAHLEQLAEQWTHRRDHGDAVPSAETLTKWIEQTEAELIQARAAVKKAIAEESKPDPLA